ncbi:hypothetical protein AB5I41_14275 [Sphingomonas sp. MMS24-JH45]
MAGMDHAHDAQLYTGTNGGANPSDDVVSMLIAEEVEDGPRPG